MGDDAVVVIIVVDEPEDDNTIVAGFVPAFCLLLLPDAPLELLDSERFRPDPDLSVAVGNDAPRGDVAPARRLARSAGSGCDWWRYRRMRCSSERRTG